MPSLRRLLPVGQLVRAARACGRALRAAGRAVRRGAVAVGLTAGAMLALPAIASTGPGTQPRQPGASPEPTDGRHKRARLARAGDRDGLRALLALESPGPAGGPPAIIRTAIVAANRIAGLPYRWGGGHGSFVDTGYDCSGSVSYVLGAIGRLGTPVTSSGLMSYGDAGPGRWITIYANPGHTFMVIAGRRFDTSGRAATGTRWQPWPRATGGYVVRHPVGL